jgi:hypothetical protein
MSACPSSHQCPFYLTVEPSIALRVRYVSAFGYCRAGMHDRCALHEALIAGRQVSRNLMPDGTMGDWADDERTRASRRFLVIEDSPVFAALASSTIASHYSDAEIVRRASFAEAEPDLRSGGYSAVVCGYGLGDGRTAHDVRAVTPAPMVVFTGRLEGLDVPVNARIVEKSAGPEALMAALRASLA